MPALSFKLYVLRPIFLISFKVGKVEIFLGYVLQSLVYFKLVCIMPIAVFFAAVNGVFLIM